MKACIAVLTLVDNDEIGAAEIRRVLEDTRYPNYCISPHVFRIETVEIGEWDDDHPLNRGKTALAEWHRLFPSLSAFSDAQDEPIAEPAIFREALEE